MMALMIILIIIAIIAILMIIPINLCFDYDGESLKLWINYFFFKIPLLPQKPKKKKEKKKKSHKETKKPEEVVQKKKKKQNGISEIIEILSDVLDFVREFTRDVRKKLFVKELKIDIVVATGDAYSTAMDFGYACSGIYTITGMMTSFITFNEFPDINIKADFDKNKTTSKLIFKICLRPILLIIIVFKYIIKAIKLYMKIFNDDNKDSKEKLKKDGAKNGK